MAASPGLPPPAPSRVQSALLLFAFRLLRFLGGGSWKRRPSPQLGWACQLQRACQAAGCRAWNNGWWHQLF